MSSSKDNLARQEDSIFANGLFVVDYHGVSHDDKSKFDDDVELVTIDLVDKSSSGKVNDWANKKENSTTLAESHALSGKVIRDEIKDEADDEKRIKLWKELKQVNKKALKVSACASNLWFEQCTVSPMEHPKKFNGGLLCNTRLCPLCGWRYSLRTAAKFKEIAHTLATKKKVRWIFLTLTIQNVREEDLQTAITDFLKAWKRMSELKRFKDATIGWYRALEVTRNCHKGTPWYGTYHPHMHIVIAVSPKYFKTNLYISAEEFSMMWKQSLRADYTPIIDIRVIRDKRNRQKEIEMLSDMEKSLRDEVVREQVEKGLGKSGNLLPASAIAEVAKYPLKHSTVLSEPNLYSRAKAVRALDNALKNRRLIDYGGELKKIFKDIKKLEEEAKEKLKELEENGDKEEKVCKCSVCLSDMEEVMYGYLNGQYVANIHKKKNLETPLSKS